MFFDTVLNKMETKFKIDTMPQSGPILSLRRFTSTDNFTSMSLMPHEHFSSLSFWYRGAHFRHFLLLKWFIGTKCVYLQMYLFSYRYSTFNVCHLHCPVETVDYHQVVYWICCKKEFMVKWVMVNTIVKYSESKIWEI